MAKAKHTARSENWVDFSGAGSQAKTYINSGGTPESLAGAAPSLTSPGTVAAPSAKATVPSDLPPVPRPDVPETTEQASPNAMESALGAFTGFMDKVTPDDMGGFLKGESGLSENIPLWDQTVGAASDVMLSSGGELVDAMVWGTEQMNHLGAALMSWMPGGIRTLDWEQSQNISYGQVVMANNGIAAQQNRDGNWMMAQLSLLGTQQISQAAISIDPDQPVTQAGFNILDEKDRTKAFTDNTAGMLGSGASDGAWGVAADPTIIFGKASTVLRTGLKVGEFGGLSNQALRTFGQVQKFGGRLDDSLEFQRTAGASGKWSPEAENVQDLISKDAQSLDNNVFVKSSPDADGLKQLALQVDPKDFETGVALVKAAAGLEEGWTALRVRSPLIYDQMAARLGVDPMQPVAGTARFTADQAAYGTAYINAAEKAAGQLITRGGNRLSPQMARMANSYRGGASKNQFADRFGKTVTPVIRADDSPVFSKSQWATTTLQAAAGARPVQIVRWLGSGTPSGVVHLKGGDGVTGTQEVSAWLRKSSLTPADRLRYFDAYSRASTVEVRQSILLRLEDAEIVAIAAKKGVPADAARAAYTSYMTSRKRHLENFKDRNTNFSWDPQTGAFVKSPNLYTELDEAFPLLNQKLFTRVVGKNAAWMRSVEDVSLIADVANTWWKLSVLMRLGYTQRNVTEGMMRSVATIGLIASNPKAMAMAFPNSYHYAKMKGLGRQAKLGDQHVLSAYENLTNARAMLLDAHKAAKIDELNALKTTIANHDAMIARLAALPSLTKAQARELRSITKKRADAVLEHDDIKVTFVDPAQPNLARLSAAEQALLAEVDAASDDLLKISSKVRAASARRTRLGYSANRMTGGEEYQGAFMGAEGSLAAKLSSADKTAAQTFNASYEARASAKSSQGQYIELDPATLNRAGLENYFDEYALRLNQRWRNDPMVKMWLKQDATTSRGIIIDDTIAWMKSKPGRGYLTEMQHVKGNRSFIDAAGNVNSQAVSDHVEKVYRLFENELPKGSGLRGMLLDDAVTPGEIASSLRGKDLPIIPGRDVSDPHGMSLFEQANDKAKKSAGFAMKWIGSLPETNLLRHPFYNTIYKERQKQLYDLAARQGADMGSPIIKTRINRSAHAEALKATKSTLYTIERLSNASQLLRFVSPFFPAFENSIRTWGRIAYEDPAVLAYGDKLWNIPNNMGWVIDPKNIDPETNEPVRVKHSNMFKDEGYYIVWPQDVADFFRKDTPFTPGESLMTRQSGLNVVFPGSEPWFSGVGPMTQTPVAVVLRGKPDTTDVLRSLMTPEMFRNIVPNGDPNTDLTDLWLNTAAKKVKQWLFKGTDEDGAYLTLMQTLTEDAYIDAQVEQRSVTPADLKRVEAKAGAFQKWQIGAAMLAPAQSTLNSRYSTERFAWTALLDDQSLTYEDKVKAFTAKFPKMGDSLLAITRSGSAGIYGVQPNLSSYNRVVENPDFVKQLNTIDPQLVGMFANIGSFDEPYSASAAGELRSIVIGNDGKPIKYQMSPEELIASNESSDGWRQWSQISDMLDAKAVAAGFSTINSNGAESFLALANAAEKQLKIQYPAWAVQKESYQVKLPVFLAGARLLLNNSGLVGESKTMGALSEYIQVRDMIAEKKDTVSDPDAKRALNEIGYAAAAQLRNIDIGFADLYDRYLAKDDFRVT